MTWPSIAGIAGDLAGWVDEFYDQRAFGADTDLPDSDVIMMQADGKGIAMRPGHRKVSIHPMHAG